MQMYAEHAVCVQMGIVQHRFDEHWKGMEPWQDRQHRVIPNFIENAAKKTEAYASLSKKFKGDSIKIFQVLHISHLILEYLF